MIKNILVALFGNILMALVGIGALVLGAFFILNFIIKETFESPDFHGIAVNSAVKSCVYAAAFNEGDCETRKDFSCENLVTFYEGICAIK